MTQYSVKEFEKLYHFQQQYSALSREGMKKNKPWLDFHVSDVQDKESDKKKELKSASISEVWIHNLKE